MIVLYIKVFFFSKLSKKYESKKKDKKIIGEEIKEQRLRNVLLQYIS